MKEAKRVLLTGGTGFIGTRLINALVAHGNSVSVATRHPENYRTARSGVEYVGWLPDLSRFTAIIHLAGESIHSAHWTPAVKDVIRSSRVDSTRKLVDAIGASSKRPSVFISASAVGYYGDRGDEELPENASSGSGFLAEVCAAWEHEAARAETFGVRTVRLRIGVVLGPGGGALQELVPIFRLGIGGPIGSGRAWFAWIHRRDLEALMLFALDDERVRGPLNAVAPKSVRNREFSTELGRALHRPSLVPVPPFALRLRFGEVADAMLASQRVVPEKALALGFPFEFPDVRAALADLVR